MKRVLVTGGASGIGLRMAERFGADGALVAVIDADHRAVDALKEVHPEVLAVTGDVADEVTMDNLFARLAADWGGLDVACANAGIGGPAAMIENQTLVGWKRTLAVNLDGAFLTARGAARLMRPAGQGVILLSSSTSGLHGHPARAPYCAAKWGVIGLAKTLAMELGPAGIRVNALCPGAVEGPRMERVLLAEAAATGRTPDEIHATYATGTSLGSWVTADDVAEAALWLASDAARRITGQAIPIDGYTERMR